MREPIASQYFTVDVTDGAFLFERQEKERKKKAHFSYTPLLCRTYAYVDEHQRERKEEMGRETENVNRSSLSQCWRPISDHTESIHKLRKRRTRTTKRVTPTCTHVSVFRPTQCECVKLGLPLYTWWCTHEHRWRKPCGSSDYQSTRSYTRLCCVCQYTSE